MEKKYILFKENENDKYFRIKSLLDFGKGLFKVTKDEIGGIVSDENVLSQEGDCWIQYNCHVIDSIITNNSFIGNNAKVINSIISDNVKIIGNCEVLNSIVSNNVQILGNSKIINNCKLSGNIIITNNSIIKDNVEINSNKMLLKNNARICGPINISQDNIVIEDNANNNIKTMLLLRYGKPDKNNNYKVYKLVKSTNNKNIYTSLYDNNYIYDLTKNKEIKREDHKNNNKLCNSGINILFDKDYYYGNIKNTADKILTCNVNVNDIINIDFNNYNNHKAIANKIKVLYEQDYPIVNYDNTIKIVHKLNTKNILPMIYNNNTFETFDFYKAISVTKDILYVKLDISIIDSVNNYSYVLLAPQKTKNLGLMKSPKCYKCNIKGNHDNVYKLDHNLNNKNIITVVYNLKTMADVTLHTANIYTDYNYSILKFDKILESYNEYRVLLLAPFLSTTSKIAYINKFNGIASNTPYYNLYTFNGLDCYEKEDYGEYSIIIHHSLSTYDVCGSILNNDTSEIQPLCTYRLIRIDENNVKINFLKMPEKDNRYTLFLVKC